MYQLIPYLKTMTFMIFVDAAAPVAFCSFGLTHDKYYM